MKIVRRNYFILLLLGLLFAAPGLSAYFFYTHPNWLGAAATNNGTLLSPPVLLTHLASGGGLKWKLVLWSPTACDASCIEQLDKLARIRLALGRRLYEVTPQLLLGANVPDLSKTLVNALHEQDIHIVKLPADARERPSVLQDHLAIFIANPKNYLVLAYEPTVKPDAIFQDIKQLLNTTNKMSE